MTKDEHDELVLAAHFRFAQALMAKDDHEARGRKIDQQLQSAEAELRNLARNVK